MRAVIYGAGAMGTALGAFIAAAGGEIDLVSRNAEHIGALKKNGARITGGADFSVAVNAYTPDAMSGKYDIIFLMTKQRDNAHTLEFLRGFIAADGVVCTMQNGLPEPSVAKVVGEKRCLGCAVSWGAEIAGAGCVRLTSDRDKMTFSLGSPYGVNGRETAVANMLSLAGKVVIEENFIGARWAKLAVNGAFSSVSAITGLTFGEVAKRKPYKMIALRLMNEAFAAARSSGVKIAPIQGHDIVKIYGYNGALKRALASALMPLAMKNHGDIVSGMCRDLMAGRKCDIDYVNGEIVRAAEHCGVSVPLNSAVVALVHGIENGERDIRPENIDFLLKL